MNEAAESAGVIPGERDLELFLEDIAGTIAQSQRALLAGRVHDFEGFVARLDELGRKLEVSLCKRVTRSFDDAGLVTAAGKVRDQNRIFEALLRRMRRNLALLQRAMAGPQPTYQAPIAAWRR